MTSPMNSPVTPAAPRYLLVMTATVAPPPNAQVKRSSPQVRREDYKRALRFWLRYPHASAERILFLENSGSDLSELRAIAETENPLSREVEFLSLPAHEIPPGTNYGYTEMQTLDQGVALSKLRPATTHMVKVTGRLTFPALGKALDRIAGSSSVPYDRVLRNSNREMNSTGVRLLEHLIFRKVIPFKGHPGYYLRFPCNIDPVGHFGFKDRRYDSPRTAVSRGMRAMLRVIAPNYWF